MRLHVEVDGSGSPLALLNGARCTVRSWDRVVARLAEHFTVIRHDIRGTGRSEPGPSGEYTFENYAADLAEICTDLGFERIRLWGMAWGARVALVTAALYPDRVERLVLTDLGIDPADPQAQRAGVLEARRVREASGLVDQPKPEGAFDHGDPDAMAAAMGATKAHPDLMPFVERCVAPVLIATGDHDPNLDSSRRALGGFEKVGTPARLEVIDNAGHGVVFDRPDRVVDLALAHLL